MTSAFYIFAFPVDSNCDRGAFNLAKRRGIDGIGLPFDENAPSLVERLEATHPQPGVFAILTDPGREDFSVDFLKRLTSELVDVRYARAFRRPIVILDAVQSWQHPELCVETLRASARENGVGELVVVGADREAALSTYVGCDLAVGNGEMFSFDVSVSTDVFREQTSQYISTRTRSASANLAFVNNWTPASRPHLDAFIEGVVDAAGSLPAVEGDAFPEHLLRYAPLPGAAQ